MASRVTRSTAFGAAMMKALERYTDPAIRLFDDPLAPNLLPGTTGFILRSPALRGVFRRLVEGSYPGLFGGLVCRTRAIDDASREALAGGASQVVLLGAGFDTRPYRLPEMRKVRVWELDLPEVQSKKRQAVTRALGGAPGHVRYVPIDFDEEDLLDALRRAGFDAEARTLSIWEGVTQYVPRSTIDRTFRFASSAALGSRLVFTYVPEVVLAHRRHEHLVRRLGWQSGLDPRTLAEDLGAYGLHLLDDAGANEYEERYLRPLGRSLAVYDLERVAVAVKE